MIQVVHVEMSGGYLGEECLGSLLRMGRSKVFLIGSLTSADGAQRQSADIEVDVAAGKVPGLAELLDDSDATVIDGVDVHADGDTAVVYDSGNGGVEIPDDPAAASLPHRAHPPIPPDL